MFYWTDTTKTNYLQCRVPFEDNELEASHQGAGKTKTARGAAVSVYVLLSGQQQQCFSPTPQYLYAPEVLLSTRSGGMQLRCSSDWYTYTPDHHAPSRRNQFPMSLFEGGKRGDTQPGLPTFRQIGRGLTQR